MIRGNIDIIVIAVIAVLILLVFLIVKNRRDRKKYFSPGSSDPVEEEIGEEKMRKDKI